MPASVVSSASTASVGIADRLAYWEEYNAAALVGLACTTYQPEGLLARQRNLAVDGIRVADIAGNAHVVERAPRMVASHPKDATFVSMLLDGEAFFYHPGGCVTVRAGDVLVYDTDRPYLFGFSTAMRQLLVDIPAEVYVERCGPRLRGPVLVPRGQPGSAGSSARSLRNLLLEVTAAPAEAPTAVGTRALSLVRGLCHGTGGGTHLRNAKDHIAAHLADPGLCPDAVAHAVGVSVRHLNRAFAAEDTTVARYILACRLDRARADLAAPELSGFRVADIAFRWGFASHSHFSRQFRARYGFSPSARAPARAPAR